MSLEQALEKLEKNAEKVKDKDIGIDESLKLIDESKKLYEYASAIISEYRQKIQIYIPEEDRLEDLDDEIQC